MNGFNRPHHVVGIAHRSRRHESVRILLQRQLRSLIGDADQTLLDAEAVHLVQCQRNRIARRQVFRHPFEHVINGEFELLARLPVLGLLADEVVLAEALPGKADHRVEHRQPGTASHKVLRI